MEYKPFIEDILQYKDQITEFIKDFFNATDISLFLSNNHTSMPDNWISLSNIPEEKKILINIFTAEGKTVVLSLTKELSDQKSNESFKLFLKTFKLLLENIHIKKLSNYDINSGSLHFQSFLKEIVSNIETVSNHLHMDSSNFRVISDLDFLHGRFILACISIDNYREIIQKIGISEWFALFRNIKEKLHILGKIFYYNNSDKIYLIINEKEKKFYETFWKMQNDIKNYYHHKYDFLNINIKCLYLIYPQDIPSYLFKKDKWDIAYELLLLLKKGVNLIKKHDDIYLHPIPLSNIIQKYGNIEERLIENMVKINIGEDFGVRCGDYFSVIDKKNQTTKGEIIITNVDKNYAIGEVIYLCDPFFEINKGDLLNLVCDRDIEHNYQKTNFKHAIIDIYFLVKDLNKFCTVLIKGKNNTIKKIINLFYKKFDNVIHYNNFGINKNIVLLNGININNNDEIFLDLKKLLLKDDSTAIGITNYPLLDLKKYDIIKWSIDSLEHAELLSPPKIAIFDSITFNLRGDRYFLSRDIISAVAEYKRAIALDEANHVAINSLGVCFVKLGELCKAIELFENAFELDQNITYCYNLGSAYLKLKDYEKAKKAYLKCYQLDPSHIFTIIRLAQLFEISGELDKAEQFYKKVNPKKYPFVLRLLGKISLAKKDLTKAKQLLEEAIRQNPDDSEAIFLLGKLYLENFKDKNMAITLIKKSIALRPQNIHYKRYFQDLTSKIEKI